MRFRYNEEKNRKLLELRGISFEEIIIEIKNGNLIRITKHHNNSKYPNQEIMEVRVLEMIYMVPCITEHDNTIFLKTLYPSRKATKKYNQNN